MLIERVVAGHECQHTAGLQGVDRLGEEIIVQRELLSAIIELQVGEGHVADHRVEAVLRQPRVAEILDPDVMVGMNGPCNAAGDGIQFAADKVHPPGAISHEVTDAATGLQYCCVARNAEAGDGVVHRLDNDG